MSFNFQFKVIMAETFIEIELKPYKLIDLYLTSRGITSKWVADYTEVSPSLIHMIRTGKATLTEEMRQKINELLETDY